MAVPKSAYSATVEVRVADANGAVTLTGTFAYDRRAADRRERFAANSLTVTGETRLLYAHDPSAVLADEPSGSLTVSQDATGLTFTATLPPAESMATHQRDAVSLVRQGLAVGLSPGFGVTDEEHRAGERVIKSAVLHELSIVPRAAYQDSASVALRTADEVLTVKVHAR